MSAFDASKQEYSVGDISRMQQRSAREQLSRFHVAEIRTFSEFRFFRMLTNDDLSNGHLTDFDETILSRC